MSEPTVELTPVEKESLAKGNSVMMESLRSFTLQTTKGHGCVFEARKPRLVPRVIAQEAMAAGCAPVNIEDIPFLDNLAKSQVEFDPPLRRAILFITIDSLVTENKASKFDGGGFPKPEVVEEMTATNYSKKEIVAAFNEFRNCKANNRELPSHPSAPKVYEIIQAEGKQDLILIAKAAGYPERQVAGMSSKDLRRLLLTKHVIAQR